MMERLNRLRQVKDVVYSVPKVASYESSFNINYEKDEDLYEKLTNLVFVKYQKGSNYNNLILSLEEAEEIDEKYIELKL